VWQAARLAVFPASGDEPGDVAQHRRRLAANSFIFRRALRRGSRFADRLGLRIADRLGKHRMQLSLGALLRSRVTVFCHLVLRRYLSSDFAASLAKRSAFNRS